jgi:general secretion pathway protein J
MKPRYRSGFTLVEVILAVTLLGLIVTAVYSIWSSALQGWKRSGSLTETLQRERVVFGALEEMTASLVFMRSDKALYEIRGVHKDDGDSISFVTASDAFLSPADAGVAGMRRVTLSQEYDEYRQPYLGIRNTAALAEETKEPGPPRVLSAEVTGFTVRYRHPQTGAWQNEWSERNLLPAGIEYTITFAAGSGPQAVATTATRLVEVPLATYVVKTGGLSATTKPTASGRSGGRSTGPVIVRPVVPGGTGGRK